MKIFIKYLILLLIFLLSNNLIIAQSVAYRNLTTKDGLPSNTVYQIKQDKKGFIWIATANGLVRYDGKNIIEYTLPNISDKDILGLYIDNQDIIWFWNLTGELHKIQNNEIRKIQLKPNSKVKDFVKYQNKYYIITEANILILNKDGTRDIIFESNGIHYFIKSSDKLLVKKRTFIYEINGKIVKYKYDFHNPFFPNHTSLSSILYYSFYNTNWGLAINSKLYKIEDDGSFLGISNIENLVDEGVKNLFQDSLRQYWVVLDNEVVIVDSTEQHIINRLEIKSQINGFLHDKEGNYWLSTNRKGILIVVSTELNTQKRFSNSTNDFSINQLFLTENNNLLISTNKQIIVKSFQTGVEKKISFNNKRPIYNIKEGFNDEIWIVSNDKAVVVSEDLKVKYDNIGLNSASFKSIFFDQKEKLILIGHYNGAFKVSESTYKNFINRVDNLTFTDIRQTYNIPIIKERVYTINKVNNKYWLGSTNGLYEYDGKNTRLTDIPELQNTWITHIINKNDTTWVATQTDGLFQLINKKIINHYNENNGLISNNCKTLAIENGIVWIGTNNGINRINLATNEIELINNLDGLADNDITALVVDNEKIYVGTSEGLMSFDKNIQTKNTVPPPIYHSSFQIFEKDTILSESYTLKHNENNIRIGFTGVSFRSQGTIKYKYRMQGLSDNWVETTSDYVSYPVLNSGTYDFEVFAINEDGVESESPIQIKIHIKTPFWQTWWFISLTTILFLLLIWKIITSRVNRIRNQLKLKNNFQQRINNLEMQALQVQMNPHFIFNVLNSIQHYLATNDSEQAMLYLAQFAKLIRIIFENAKRTTISLTDEVDFLKLYIALETLRFKDKVKVDFKVQEDIYTDEVILPPLLIQPIVENTFKHGFLHKKSKGNLKIHFFIEHDLLKCRITDDGIGRKNAAVMKSWKNKKHQSSGLSVTEERLEIWFKNQNANYSIPEEQKLFKITDLENEAGENIGTQVELILNTYTIDEFE